MAWLVAASKRGLRLILVMGLVLAGSTCLVRYAPGYLSDSRELDARYAAGARTELAQEAQRSASIWSMLAAEIRASAKGDFGTSRQYEVPVGSLMAARVPVTARLLGISIVCAWLLSAGAALLATLRASGSARWLTLWFTVLLALPTSVLTTLSLLSDLGGPVVVLTLVLAARDFTMLERILRKAVVDPHILQARAQGIRWHRLMLLYVAPTIAPQVAAVAGLSVVTALGAIIPVEVLFGVPGVGQLAWNAAMNRDLPVLLAVTALIAVIMAATTGALRARPALEAEAA